MTEKETSSGKKADLRRQAEEIARGNAAQLPAELEAMSPEEIRQTLHELQVHQIELEMQNDELRRAHTELDAVRERYFDLYDLAPVGYLTVSKHGLIIEANLTAATLLGMPRSTLVKRPLSGFILKQDQNIYYLHRKQLFETEEPQTCELRMVKNDSSQFWVWLEATIAKDFQGEPRCLVVLSNISRRKQAENALREYGKRLQSFFEMPLIGIAITSLEKGWLEVNDALCKTLGYPRGKLVEMTWAELTHPDDLEADEANFNRILAGEIDGYSMEKRFICADGRVINSELAVRCIRKPDGQIDYIAAMIKDITDRKQAEAFKEKMEEQNRQIEKSESLGLMAGAIAHHFNNQLGVVIGNLELAMMELPKGSKLNDNLTSAMSASSKAAEMSGIMLAYLGQSFNECEPLYFSTTCQQCLPILKTAMPGNVILETDLPSPGPAVSTNAVYIQQVLTNMIINAREAVGDSKGIISLSVKTVAPAEIPLVHRFPLDWQPQDNDYACLEVTDTGSGIEGKDIKKVFDPFFTTKFTGRGMGLAVVLGIVRAHKGVVTIESKTGRGSTFRVYFPVSAEEVLRRPAKAAQSSAIEGGGTVLLVEDEEALRKMVATVLKSLGFAVLEAKDGVEAVEVFQQHQDEIRIVLSDLTMPRMDGWETLTALRKLKPGIPVILASGYDKAQVMAGDHPELPQVFLGKPYKIKGLSDAIIQALGNTESSGMREQVQ